MQKGNINFCILHVN